MGYGRVEDSSSVFGISLTVGFKGIYQGIGRIVRFVEALGLNGRCTFKCQASFFLYMRESNQSW